MWKHVPYLIGFAAECVCADELTVEAVSHIYTCTGVYVGVVSVCVWVESEVRSDEESERTTEMKRYSE